MAPTILYTACVLGAAGLYLLLRPGPRPVKALGAIVGLGAVAWLGKEAATALGPDAQRPGLLVMTFSLIVIAAAVRMITHPRPVYCALYFVLVVLSSAGLFLLLGAEFIAFALVIVYAGAILITYLFVLMLAQQAPQADDPSGQPEYDLVPREPLAGVVVGFVIMALLTDMVVGDDTRLPAPPTIEQAEAEAWRELDDMPGRRDRIVGKLAPGGSLQDDEHGHAVVVRDGRAFVDVLMPGESQTTTIELPPEAMPENVQRVGWGLVARFPVSLELAGVILLMAMFGAVVLARRQIELGEDEKREAAGMRRLALEGEAEPPDSGGGRRS